MKTKLQLLKRTLSAMLAAVLIIGEMPALTVNAQQLDNPPQISAEQEDNQLSEPDITLPQTTEESVIKEDAIEESASIDENIEKADTVLDASEVDESISEETIVEITDETVDDLGAPTTYKLIMDIDSSVTDIDDSIKWKLISSRDYFTYYANGDACSVTKDCVVSVINDVGTNLYSSEYNDIRINPSKKLALAGKTIQVKLGDDILNYDTEYNGLFISTEMMKANADENNEVHMKASAIDCQYDTYTFDFSRIFTLDVDYAYLFVRIIYDDSETYSVDYRVNKSDSNKTIQIYACKDALLTFRFDICDINNDDVDESVKVNDKLLRTDMNNEYPFANIASGSTIVIIPAAEAPITKVDLNVDWANKPGAGSFGRSCSNADNIAVYMKKNNGSYSPETLSAGQAKFTNVETGEPVTLNFSSSKYRVTKYTVNSIDTPIPVSYNGAISIISLIPDAEVTPNSVSIYTETYKADKVKFIAAGEKDGYYLEARRGSEGEYFVCEGSATNPYVFAHDYSNPANNKITFKPVIYNPQKYDISEVKIGSKVLTADADGYYTMDLQAGSTMSLTVTTKLRTVETGYFYLEENDSWSMERGDSNTKITVTGATRDLEDETKYILNNTDVVTIGIRVDGRHTLGDTEDRAASIYVSNEYYDLKKVKTVIGTDSSTTYTEYSVNVPASALNRKTAYYYMYSQYFYVYIGKAGGPEVIASNQGQKVNLPVSNGTDNTIDFTFDSGDVKSIEYDYQPISISLGDKIDISVANSEYYKMTGYRMIYEIDGVVEKTFTASSITLAGADFVSEGTWGRVYVEPILTPNLYVSIDGKYVTGSTYVDYDQDISAIIIAGNKIAKGEIHVYEGTTELTDVISNVQADHVTLHFAKDKYAGKTLTLKEKVTVNDKAMEISVKLMVREAPKTLKIGGVDSAAVNPTIKVDFGVERELPVVLNKGVNPELITVTDSSESVSTDYDSSRQVIIVSSMLDSTGNIPEDVTLDVKYNNVALATYKLTLSTDRLNAKPKVSVASVTDANVNLSLSLPAGVDKSTQNLYYRIEGKAKSVTVPDKMLSTIEPVLCKVTDSTQMEKIWLSKEGALGTGEACVYEFTVQLVLRSVLVANYAWKSQNSVTISGATLNPAYETNLKLKNLATTVYAGQSDVKVANAVYSKSTSYKLLKTAQLESWPTKGSKYDINVRVDSSDNSTIIIDVDSDAVPGTYVISAYAYCPDGSSAPKYSCKINVKTDVDLSSAKITPSTTTLNKINKKAASLTSTIDVVDYQGSKIKPKKVEWTIYDKNKQLSNTTIKAAIDSKKLTIKNGKVNVAKDYILGPTDADNTFVIAATLYNNAGDSRTIYSTPITITNRQLVIDKVVVVPKETTSDFAEKNIISSENPEVTSDKLENAKVVALDDKGEVISDVTYKVSGSAVKLNTAGEITGFGKLGKVTVTVTTADGGKKSAKLSFSVGYAQGKLILIRQMSEEPYELIDTSDNKAAIIINIYDENGKALGATGTPLYNYTVSAKGAKVIPATKFIPKELSGYDNTYVISVTAREATITVTNKTSGESTSYKIRNSVYEATTTFKAKVKNNALLGKTSDRVEVELSGIGDATYCYALADENDCYKNTSNFITYMSNINTSMVGEWMPLRINDGKAYIPIEGNSVGSHKIKLRVGDSTKATSKVVTVTIKVVAPGKPSVNLGAVYTMSSENPTATIAVKSIKNAAEGDIQYFAIQNSNDKGTYNKAQSYLRISETGTITISSPATYAETKEALAANPYIWIVYRIKDASGNYTDYMSQKVKLVLQ